MSFRSLTHELRFWTVIGGFRDNTDLKYSLAVNHFSSDLGRFILFLISGKQWSSGWGEGTPEAIKGSPTSPDSWSVSTASLRSARSWSFKPKTTLQLLWCIFNPLLPLQSLPQTREEASAATDSFASSESSTPAEGRSTRVILCL